MRPEDRDAPRKTKPPKSRHKIRAFRQARTRYPAYIPEIAFTKYATAGDYHWRQYAAGTKYRRHADRVAAWVTEPRVLDVGAGDGCITALLAESREPGDVIGLDNEPVGVSLARAHHAPVLLGSAYALPVPDDSFDAVLLCDVLEHLAEPERALAEAARVAPVLYVVTPPARPDYRLTDRFHVREWTSVELVAFLAGCGWRVEGPIRVYRDEKVMYARAVYSPNLGATC